MIRVDLYTYPRHVGANGSWLHSPLTGRLFTGAAAALGTKSRGYPSPSAAVAACDAQY